MNTLDLNFKELSYNEMNETNGGILPLLILAVLLVSSCTTTVVVGDDNNVNAGTKVDSTANGNTVKVNAN